MRRFFHVTTKPWAGGSPSSLKSVLQPVTLARPSINGLLQVWPLPRPGISFTMKLQKQQTGPGIGPVL
jgi:hypothetical protein